MHKEILGELMIIGNPTRLAIESNITHAYARLSFRALGCFVIRVMSEPYGVNDPEATLLACSLDAVEKRINDRGSHTAFFSTEPDGGKIADAFCDSVYSCEPIGVFDGITPDDIEAAFNSSNIQWAPDGDEAFDDGSFVLQFDVEDRVRVIAFRRTAKGNHAPATLKDLWMTSEEFYAVLQQWRDAFLVEWASLPKVPDA
jgi:hypothetical protein